MAEADPQAKLTLRILIGMVLGLLLGLGLNFVGTEGRLGDLLIDGLLHVVGAIFLASLNLLVVPLVFVSLVCGTASLEDLSRLGRVGGKTLVLYLTTTAIAIALALLLGVLVQPGSGFELTTDASYQAKDPPPLSQVFIDLVPTNPVKALAEGNTLQIIVFAVLFGIAITSVGERGRKLLGIFEDLNEVVMRLVTILMALAPYGVFCLVARVFAQQGFNAIAPLATYFVLVLVVLALHMGIIYTAILRFLGGLSPLRFFRKMRPVLVVAFSTASSGATLPVTLRTVEHRLGVDNQTASFTIPLGATVNMDGTAIMQGVATAFIAQAYGIELGMSGYLMVVLTATLASIGTAAVPGAGLVMLTLVLRQVNLPVEGIGLIIGIDRLLDMSRTAVNVTGDAVVACVVAKSEGTLNLEIFDGE